MNPLRGKVLLPDDPAWDEARRIQNHRFSPQPAALIYCADTEDVAAALQWAKQRGLGVSVRGGGHHFEGYCALDGHVVLDLQALDTLEIDAENRLVRVGAGLRLGRLTESLARQGLVLPAGTCPSVGITGLTLGGGFGFLSRLWGLTCDHLLRAVVVLADGQTITTTELDRPELLWALRGGGGGNFGVVTELTFRVQRLDRVSLFWLRWKGESAATVLATWQEWAPLADERLVCSLRLGQQDPTHQVDALGLFVGADFEIASLIHPLRSAGETLEVETFETSYLEASRLLAGTGRFSVNPHPLPCFKGASDYALWPLTDDGIELLLDRLRNAPTPTPPICRVTLENAGGAVARLPADATAFPHRAGVLFSLQYQAFWTDPAAEAAGLAWVRGTRDALTPYLAGAAYLNYCDGDLERWLEAYYAGNLPRLRRLKRQFDPENYFRFPQSIPPAAP